MAIFGQRFFNKVRSTLGPQPEGPARIEERFVGARPVYEPTSRDIMLIGDVNEKLTLAARARYEFDRTWFMNISMFLGFHYHSFAERTARLLAPQVPAHRVRLVCNRIFPTVQARVAKIVRNRPIINVIPGTTDDENLFKARCSDKFLKYLDDPDITCMDDDSALERNIDLAFWMELCGTVFEKTDVDPCAGEYIEEPRVRTEQGMDPRGFAVPQRVPILDQDGAAVVDRYWTGDVATNVISPFDMYPKPGARKLGQGWFIIAYMVPVEETRLRFPEKETLIQPSRDWTISRFFSKRLQGLVSLGRFSSDTDNNDDECVLMKEYHEPPSTVFKKGRIVTLAGDVLLSEVTDPALGWMNVVKYVDTPVPGRLWGETPITQMVPLNKGYNRGRSAVKEWKNLMANIKILVARGGNPEEVAWDGDSGEFIEYTPISGAKEPFHLQPAEMPVGAFKDMEYDVEDMKYIGGVNDPSMGINPPNVESGLQLQYLAEMDDSKFAPTVTLFEKSKERTALLQLEAAKLTYDLPRLLTIVGESQQHEAFEFSRDMIPVNYRVRVQAGSALPYSLAAKREFIMNMWDRHMIVDPYTMMPDVREAHRLLEFGDYEKYLEEKRQDEKNAEMENRFLKQGEIQQIKIEVFDDHAVHIARHNKFRKMDWYRMLPMGHPIRLFFDDHVSRHEATAVALAVRAQMLGPGALTGPDAEQEQRQIGPKGNAGGNGKPGNTDRGELTKESKGGSKGGTKSRANRGKRPEGQDEARA